jgi:hypothetical protein
MFNKEAYMQYKRRLKASAGRAASSRILRRLLFRFSVTLRYSD